MSRKKSTLVPFWLALAMPVWGVSQESPAPKPAPPISTTRTDEEIRVEMLEKLADQLSLRMRSLKEREAALSAREDALVEREKATRKREEMISSMEELMHLREEVVKRREKLPLPQTWNGPPPPAVYGQYAAVIDGETMQFYHKKQAEARVPVASTQKLVTALVICQEGNLDGMAEIPKEVLEVEPTVVGVKPGETYTRRQLLTALLVKSGNDIAATLAIDNAGSIDAFAQKMNTYARFIGMTDSNFVNPHGLPAEGQYSTARDMAIAAFEAYQNPDIREMVSKKSYDFVFNDGHIYTLPNTNRVLTDMEGCNGMKTGFTYAAGNCLVCSASVDGKDRISVVLKSARPQVQEDSKALLNWSLGLQFTGPMQP
jgi:D-alanyl-D-alanine carboxypeptidase (penicillin-binding protein 5/6)